MTLRTKLLAALTALTSVVGGAALATEPSSVLEKKPLPEHKLPASKEGNLVVGLCDGETSMEVKGVKQGEKMTRAQAQEVSGKLMEEWRRKNPNANWADVPASAPGQRIAQASKPPPSPNPEAPRSPAAVPRTPENPSAGRSVGTAGPTSASGAPQAGMQMGTNVQSGHTYGAFSERDEKIWAESTKAFVEEGNRVFHDAEALGGTIAVSCDMCHPDAANTHPETYPKYQVQLGRVAMLRDMINWCIQNPVRGKPLADDDPKMKALEAFIYARRKGVPLDFGKH